MKSDSKLEDSLDNLRQLIYAVMPQNPVFRSQSQNDLAITFRDLEHEIKARVAQVRKDAWSDGYDAGRQAGHEEARNWSRGQDMGG